MDVNKIKSGMKVKVVSLGSTMGMLIHEKHLSIREVGKEGIVKNWVPGHGGDVWAITQDNGVACYCYDEIEEVEDIVKPNWADDGLDDSIIGSLP